MAVANKIKTFNYGYDRVCIMRYAKIRNKLIPRIYAKLDEINKWWCDKYPVDNAIICSIDNVDIRHVDVDRVHVVSLTLVINSGLFGFKHKLHGDTVDEALYYFEIDYKNLLAILQKDYEEMVWSFAKDFINSLK